MSEPVATDTATAKTASCPASPRAKWIARGVFLLFLLKGLAWLLAPALIALGLSSGG